jgi:hypothetical protein
VVQTLPAAVSGWLEKRTKTSAEPPKAAALPDTCESTIRLHLLSPARSTLFEAKHTEFESPASQTLNCALQMPIVTVVKCPWTQEEDNQVVTTVSPSHCKSKLEVDCKEWTSSRRPGRSDAIFERLTMVSRLKLPRALGVKPREFRRLTR